MHHSEWQYHRLWKLYYNTTLLIILNNKSRLKTYLLSITNINLMSLMCTILVTDSLGLWNHSTCSCHKSQGSQSIETNFIRKWKPARTSQLTAETFLLHHYICTLSAYNLGFKPPQNVFTTIFELPRKANYFPRRFKLNAFKFVHTNCCVLES